MNYNPAPKDRVLLVCGYDGTPGPWLPVWRVSAPGRGVAENCIGDAYSKFVAFWRCVAPRPGIRTPDAPRSALARWPDRVLDVRRSAHERGLLRRAGVNWLDEMIVVSLRGRIWSKREVASLCRHYIRRLWSGTAYCDRILAEVDGVLDDEKWCRNMRGTIPAWFAREVEEEAHRRSIPDVDRAHACLEALAKEKR